MTINVKLVATSDRTAAAHAISGQRPMGLKVDALGTLIVYELNGGQQEIRAVYVAGSWESAVDERVTVTEAADEASSGF